MAMQGDLGLTLGFVREDQCKDLNDDSTNPTRPNALMCSNNHHEFGSSSSSFEHIRRSTPSPDANYVTINSGTNTNASSTRPHGNHNQFLPTKLLNHNTHTNIGHMLSNDHHHDHNNNTNNNHIGISSDYHGTMMSNNTNYHDGAIVNDDNLEWCLRALHTERLKIEAFRRELPMCMRLLDGAISATTAKLNATSNNAPSSINYMQLYDADNDANSTHNEKTDYNHNNNNCSNISMNHDEIEDHHRHRHHHGHYVDGDGGGDGGGGGGDGDGSIMILKPRHPGINMSSSFLSPLNMMKPSGSPLALPISSSSCQQHTSTTMTTVSAGGPTEGGVVGVGVGVNRKPRRCWSPELHQLFLHALHRLGGPQLATPKQIRELMNVQGLTNDEVKSHLQKFRLHTRRPIVSSSCSEAYQQPHHLVLFGGIWVPTSPVEQSSSPHQQSTSMGAHTCDTSLPPQAE